MSFYQARRHPRIEFKLMPWAFALRRKRPYDGENPLRIEARNISQGGLKFVSNQRIPLFESVEISLFEKTSGKEVISLAGKVIRLEEVDTGQGEKTFGVALEFADDQSLAPLLASAAPANP